jgi:hypothetical protein
MNILPIKPSIKITIFEKDHDPSKEFELIAPKKEDEIDEPINSYTQIVNAPYGLSAIIIFKESKYWKDPENSYDLIHNCREIHYMHCLFSSQIKKAKETNTCQIDCAFEGWGRGKNMHSFGTEAKEMHIIKSPKWFDKHQDQVEYQHHQHPPIDKEVHPTWTGYLPPYAAKQISA